LSGKANCAKLYHDLPPGEEKKEKVMPGDHKW